MSWRLAMELPDGHWLPLQEFGGFPELDRARGAALRLLDRYWREGRTPLPTIRLLETASGEVRFIGRPEWYEAGEEL